MRYTCLHLLVVLLLSQLNWGQQQFRSFLNFGEKEGLTDKYVYAVTQDQQHGIWIGTGTGLYRFDGKKFFKVKSNLDQPGRQIANVLQNVYTDRTGKIWMSSINAVQIFDPKKNQFTALDYQQPLIQRMIKAFVMGFYEDTKGNMWIATQSDYWYRYHIKTRKITHFVPKDVNVTQASKDVLKILETNDGKLWAITTHGLFEFSAEGKIQPHWNISKGKLAGNNFYDGFFDTERHCIWLAGGYDGIVSYHLGTKQFQNVPLVVKHSKNSNPANMVTLIAPKDKNTLWFSAGVLGEYTIATGKFFNYEVQYKDEFSFRTTPVSRLFTDNEKNLWIASYSGLCMLPWQNNQIQSYPLFNSYAQYTVEPYGTLRYKNGYLIANNTSNGLLWFQPQQQKTTLLENPFYKGKYRKMKGIVALAQLPNQTIYAASSEDLFVLDTVKNLLRPLSLRDQHGRKPQNIVKMMATSHNELLLASGKEGYYWYRPNDSYLQHISLKAIVNQPYSDSKLIIPRWEDRFGNIWFTYTQGVYCLDRKTGKYHHYGLGKALNNSAVISQSIDMVQDEEGHFWITTLDGGLFELYLEKGKEKLYNYTAENSKLPSDYCVNITSDSKGFLWIGNANGLIKFNPKSRKVITVLGQQHGFKDNGMTVALNKLSDGSIAVNYYGQLAIFQPETYRLNRVAPAVHWTKIKVLDRYLKWEEVQKRELNLAYQENFITLEWATSVANHYNQTSFLYRCIGLDDHWRETNQNRLSYASLPPGTYTLEVKAVNNDGIEGPVERLKISIKAPFWKTLWFYMLLVSVLGTLLFLWYRFQLRHVKKEEQLRVAFQQQLAEIEMKALRAQMNPHFIFNSLNSIQKYILKNDSFEASQYLTKFSKLIRLILDHSNQNYIVLASEIELLTLYVEIESLRFEGRFEYEFNIDTSLPIETLEIPSMIIQPYIENAIWHGLLHKETKGTLWITIQKYTEDSLQIIVKDDGVGREKARELKSKQILKKKSYGLQITEDRITILNRMQSQKTLLTIKDNQDEKGAPLGTEVVLVIPVKNM